MGVFSGIEEDQGAGGGGPYFVPGVFIVQITECSSGESREGVEFFAVRCDVLDTTDAAALPIGTSVSWWVGIQKDTPALRNIKEFVARAMECDVREVTQAGCEMIVGPEQPLRGTVMRCRAKNILTKKGTDFTVCEWSLYEGTPAQVQRMREAAKLVAPRADAEARP